MKLKKMPSMKAKKRYIAFRVHSEKPVIYHNVRDAIFDSLRAWLGMKGLSASNYRLVKNLWNEKLHAGVLSCSHKSVDDVKVGLMLVSQIGDHRVAVQTLAVSGTIKGAKSRLLDKHSLTL